MPPFKSRTANLVFEICKPVTEPNTYINITDSEANDFLKFAARNGVAPWCYYKLKNATAGTFHFPDTIQAKLRMQYLQTLVMNQQKWKVFKEMSQMAAQLQIPVIPLKGTALAFSLYPQEALRPMGDIDVLIPEDKIYKFRDLMLKNEARPLHVPISKLHERVHAHISALLWQNIMIEPHQRLFAIGSTMNLNNANLFDHIKPMETDPKVKIFDDVMQLYHLSTHTYKGYKMGGMRLGWLLDIALMLIKNKDKQNFIEQVVSLNPGAKKEIMAPIQWASLLIAPSSANEFIVPFPDEAMFHEEQNASQRHKFMVLHEILSLPGLHNKITLLFREFFPEKAYMDHQYGKQRGFSMINLYLQRIAGLK